MELQNIAQSVIFLLFLLMTVIFSFKKLDIGAYSIIIAFVAVVFTLVWEANVNGTPVIEADFLKKTNFFNYQVLLFLIFMEIGIMALREQRIFEWLSLKVIRVTKGRPRLFFYFMSIVTTIISAFMEDVSLAIIIMPLVIRTCRVLEIQPKPFIIGTSFSILLGNLLSPFATGTNIIIASAFGLNILWYVVHFFVFLVFIEAGMLIIIDLTMLKKLDPPTERQRIILLEIMNPNLLISEKPKFIRFLLYFVLIIVGLIFSGVNFPAFLVVMIMSVFLCLVERTKHSLSHYFNDVDWKLMIFLVSIFLMIGCMDINGTILLISNFIKNTTSDNVILSIIIILVVSSLISSFISKSLMAITFSTVLLELFGAEFSTITNPLNIPLIQSLQIMALIIGVALGGNLIPPGATQLLKTLEIAEENYVKGFTFRYFTKFTSVFSVICMVLGLGYLSLLLWVFG